MSGTTAGDPGDLQHYDGLEDLPEETGAAGTGPAGTGAEPGDGSGDVDDPGERPLEPGEVIDIADESGPALTTGVDDVDTGSSGKGARG